MNENLSRGMCLKCRKPLGAFEPVSARLRCGNCGHEYLVAGGRIPVLLREYEKHLAGSYLELESFVRDQEEFIKRVEQAAQEDPKRARLLKRVAEARAADNNYLRSIQDRILEYVSEEQVATVQKDADRPKQYPVDNGMSGFYRDWAWLPDTEQEIATTMGWLSDQIDRFASDLDVAAVPGAGGGRIACEIAANCESCYALDDSFHLVCNFYDLLEGDVTVHQVNMQRNVIKSEEMAVEYRLSLDPPGGHRIRSILESGKFSYFVSDALDVPLKDESVWAIICVYFIDIAPIKGLLSEVKRLLKPGGLFLNFGPLRYGYASKDINDMLSGEELLSLFEESGFDILAHETVANTQFTDPVTLTQLVSRNFAFAARKR